MASIQERLDQDAEGWRPKAGDSIVGTVVDVDTRNSDYGGDYPLLLIAPEDDGPLVAVHCFHTVLKTEVARRRPQPGDKIGIKYLGIPDGKKYEGYRVVLERPAATPNWDAIAAQAAQEQAELEQSYAEQTQSISTGGDWDETPF